MSCSQNMSILSPPTHHPTKQIQGHLTEQVYSLLFIWCFVPVPVCGFIAFLPNNEGPRNHDLSLHLVPISTMLKAVSVTSDNRHPHKWKRQIFNHLWPCLSSSRHPSMSFTHCTTQGSFYPSSPHIDNVPQQEVLFRQPRALVGVGNMGDCTRSNIPVLWWQAYLSKKFQARLTIIA